MTGKKKSKKGRKSQTGDSEPPSSTSLATTAECKGLPSDIAASAGSGRAQHSTSATAAVAGSSMNGESGAEAGSTRLPSSPPPPPPPPLLAPGGGSGLPEHLEPFSQPASTAGSEEKVAKPSFVFSAGQRVGASSAQAAGDSANSRAVSASSSARSMRPSTRRRDIKCPPSERFGKLGSKAGNQSHLQLAAQAVAFGQGRDPLTLVVSYEENGLRRIVKAPEGCTGDTIVDTTLRQAVAGTALDSAGWQEALNRPREDSYFTYSTVPEGLTIAKFRDIKGKILVTPLSTDCGLLKLKEDAEKKRKAAEEALENVREYLQKLKSEDEKESSREKSSNCAHCRSIQTQLKDLLGLVSGPHRLT